MVNHGEKVLNAKYTLDNEYIVCTKCKATLPMIRGELMSTAAARLLNS